MDAFSSIKYKSINGEKQQYNQQFNDDDSITMTAESVILGPYDVICGRGKLSFNNIGNRRFRMIIGMNVSKYNGINSRHWKGLFIRSLVDTFVNEIGAKFYKMNRNNTKQLIELTKTQRREKIGHALRDVVAFQESQQKLQREKMSVVKTTTTPTPTKQKSLPLSSTEESKWNQILSNSVMDDVNCSTDAANDYEIISGKEKWLEEMIWTLSTGILF